MKFSIDKSLLVEALDSVSKVIKGKSTLEILKGVLIEANDGQLKLTGNDLETAIRCTQKCEVFEPGAVVVKQDLFSGTIRKMPDEEIDIQLNGLAMTIEAGNAKMNIKGLSPKGYPKLVDINSNDAFEIDQQVLKTMINKVSFAAGMDENRPAFKGILLNIKNGVLDVVCSDGFMMAVRRIEIDSPDKHVLILAKVLEDVAKALKQGKMIVKLGENQAQFDGENIKTTMRTLGHEYFSYKNLLMSEYQTRIKVNVKELVSSIDRAMLLISDRDKSPIKLKIKDDKLNIVLNTSLGDFEDCLKVEMSGIELKTAFDPRRLNACLTKIDDKEVMINFVSNVGGCTIESLEGNEFTYYVLPVREKGVNA